MELTFLGTSAANAFPEAFCQCKNCEQARLEGGKSLRKRSALLINDDLLIDLGPDIMTASNLYRRPLTGVCSCLQTHAHADHLDPSHFLSRSPGYGVKGAPRLNFFASPASLKMIAAQLERDCEPASFYDPAVGELLNLAIHPVEPGQVFRFGTYQAFAFQANHDPAVEPLLYAVQSEQRCIFYGTDTAILSEETWFAFHEQSLRFDVVILDHTYGPEQPGSDHLCASQFIDHIQRFREEGLLTQHACIFATHIAHEGNPAHSELVEYGKKHGYEIAYDGLTVLLPA